MIFIEQKLLAEASSKQSFGKNEWTVLSERSRGRLKILMELDRRSKNENGRPSKHQSEYGPQS